MQRREALINQAQRLQLGRADDGWSAKAWNLLRQASDIQADDRLRDLATATLLDADGTYLACVNQRCLISLHVDVVWQAEFTAGLVVRLR